MAAAKGDAVQLVSIEESGLLVPQNFEIEDTWKDLQLGVVGIMGDQNSGKSFLMNLIAEYLQCEESGTGGWMNNLKKGKTKVSGFEMRKCENKTNSKDGLYIWPRPFIIKRTADSEKIAVVLLDLNMKDATPSMELTLSLLCSTIIYNTNSNDVDKLCRLVTTIKQSRQGIQSGEATSSINELLFQHMIILFRDQQKLKCGEDKSLNHLKSVMKENGIIDVTDESNVDSFLLPKPTHCPVNDEDCLDIDKTFSQYLTSFINKKLCMDDLQLKSWSGRPITVNNFFSMLQFLCNSVAFPLLQEFNLSCVGSSTTEPMETNSEDVNPYLSNDEEMKDVENQDEKYSLDKSKTICLAPNQYLTQTKLNEEDIPEATGEFINAISDESHSSKKTKRATATTTNQEPNISSSSHPNLNDGGTVENNSVIITNEEIDNRIKKFERSVRSKAKRFFESQQCTPGQIESEFGRIYETAKIEFEEFCSSYTINNPVRILKVFDTRILNILEEMKKNIPERDDRKKEILPVPSKPKDVSNVIESQLQLYNASMEHLLSTNMSVSKKTLTEKHTNLVNMITSTIMKVCNDENILLTAVLPSILPQLDEAYKSYQKRVGVVDDFTPRHHAVEPFLDKAFIHEFKLRLQSVSFFETETVEIVDRTINNTVQQILLKSPNFSREQIEKTISKPLTMNKYSKIADYLKTTLTLYIVEMNKKQKMYNFFSPEQVIKFHSDAIKKLSLSEENQDILDIGLEVVKEQYQVLNQDIIRNEKESFIVSIIPETKNLYEQEMKYFVEKKKPSAAQMTEEHDKLKNQCTAAIVKACLYKDPNLPILQSCFDTMNKELNIIFQTALKANPSIVEDLKNKIQGAEKKAHLEYTNAMKKHTIGKTQSASDLENLHKNCLREANVVMKIEIRSINQNEDLQPYINRLQMKTENDLKNLYAMVKPIQEKNKFERPITRQITEEEKDRRHQKWKNEPYIPDLPNDFNSHLKPKEPTPPILAIEFGLHTVKTGVIINGMINLVANRLAESQFPNIVAITKQGEVLVGNEVRYRHADISCSFNCGTLMRHPSNEVATNPDKIWFQGQEILATKEFLCGLILSRIKKDSEEFLRQPISRVVITVPLWYTSSQRQATKHAGIIAGFESVNLINDITAAALAYAKHPCNRNRHHDILIINAIAGNVDVAVFEIAEGKTKMKTCTGFLHGQSNSEAPWIFKPLVQIWKYLSNGNTSASANETAVVTKLVEHCVKNYQIATCTVLFDRDIESNTKYLEELKYIATRKQRDYIEIEGAILMGAAIFAELLNRDLKYLAGSSISDLLPYRIEFVRSNSTQGKVFERHTALNSNELKQDLSFQFYGDVSMEILEIRNTDNIKTGCLHIPGKGSGSLYVEVTAFISSEGILRFTSRQRYGAGKPIDVIWNSYNLSEEEIAKYASLISSYYPNPQQLKKLQGWKTDLRKLADALLSYSNQGVSGFGKEQISHAVQEAYKEAEAAYTTQERIEKMTNDLAKLKSRYCSQR